MANTAVEPQCNASGARRPDRVQVPEWRRQVRRNAPSLLIAANLLVVFLWALAGAFEGCASGYGASAPVLDVSQSQVERIEIIDPDLNLPGRAIALVRGERLPKSEWEREELPEEASGWEKFQRSLWDSASPEYRWTLVLPAARDGVGDPGEGAAEDAGEAKPNGEAIAAREFPADPARVRDLFEGVLNARRYYAVERSPQKDVDLEMGKDSRGRWNSLQLRFLFESCASHTIHVGRSSLSGSESYVRLDEEDRIYKVRANLRSVAGAGEAMYFRDRRVMPQTLSADSIRSLRVIPGEDEGVGVILNKTAGSWQLQAPVAAQAREEAVDALLNDIVGWNAVSFPEAPPKDSEEFAPFTLVIEYSNAGDISATHSLRLEVIARRNFSNYVLRTPGGALVEVSSLYLEDLLEPQRTLVAGEGPALRSSEVLQ